MAIEKDEILAMIAGQAGIIPEELEDETRLEEELGLDSLDMTELVCRFEDSFGISIPDSVISSFQTVKALTDYLIPVNED